MSQAPGALPRAIMSRMEEEVKQERLAEMAVPPSDRVSSVDHTASVPAASSAAPVTTANESVAVEA